MKSSLRDARKMIRKGELVDSQDLALYLQTIDARFTHIKSDIYNATQVVEHAKVRSNIVAETRKLIAFFSNDYEELNRQSQTVAKNAEAAGRTDDFKHERLSSVDITKLKDNFDALARKENENDTEER